MAKPYEMPDPKDRTVNEPHVLLEGSAIIGLYNKANPNDKKERVVESVKQWLTDKALAQGWSEVSFAGSNNLTTTAVLKANVTLEKKSD